MNSASVPLHSGFSHLKLYFALSRFSHALLDLATPALSALIWLGTIPSLKIIMVGLITALAGYLTVYALNDVVDYRFDEEKVLRGELHNAGKELDSVFVRHPIAQGFLTLKEGLLWTGAWALLALIGACILNPACAFIFVIGILLETMYCRMLKVSHYRTIVSGVVKTLGGIAAVFAVDPSPSPLFLAMLFSWLFFWEIGGQNVPSDWVDLEEDMRYQARTIPVRFGLDGSSIIIIACLALTVVVSAVFFWISPAKIVFPFLAPVLLVGLYLLLIPAFRVYKTKSRAQASILFNRASYYPLALLIIVAFRFMM